jgi:hypothetical protein
MQNFQWKSVKDLKPGDKVIDNRSMELIQYDTDESKGNKRNNTGVQGKEVLRLSTLLSETWKKVTQACLGRPLWEDTRWLSYTSQGWESGQQYDYELGAYRTGATSFLSLKEYERRNEGEVGKAIGKDKTFSVRMARVRRRGKVAQQTCEKDVGEMGLFRENLRVLWQEIQDKISWDFKVLSSKLQGKSKTKKIKRIIKAGIEPVYSMEVIDVNCFSVEGGIIVHNCVDECRYVLMSLDRLPSRFESNTFLQVKRRKYSPVSKY